MIQLLELSENLSLYDEFVKDSSGNLDNILVKMGEFQKKEENYKKNSRDIARIKEHSNRDEERLQ